MSAIFQTLATPVSLTAGTSIALTDQEIYASSVIIEADTSNTGKIYVGGSGVTSTNGQSISPGKAFTATFDPVYGVNGKIDLRTVRFATETTGNKVRALYIGVP